jgi:hypothetical protein
MFTPKEEEKEVARKVQAGILKGPTSRLEDVRPSPESKRLL